MLQLKLSNSIRQIQFLSDNKPPLGKSNLMDEKFDLKAMNDKYVFFTKKIIKSSQ